MFAVVSFLMHPVRFVRDWRMSRRMFYPDGSSRPGNGQFDDPLRERPKDH